jgi:ketosteroid isomerase-like protein
MGYDDDVRQLTELNEHFIEAFRKGSWEMLSQIMSSSFAYLDWQTGQVWDRQRYIDGVETGAPELTIDQVNIHVDGDTAVVSARSLGKPGGRYARYADTYERRPEGWRCVHAVLWRLPE